MESFKNWIHEDLEGKTLNSAGVDVNPRATAQAATQAFQSFASNKAHANDLSQLGMASGPTSQRKAITDLTPQIANYSTIPVANQQFTAPDIGRVVAQEYFPRHKNLMAMMKKMMLKKMEKK